MEAGGIFGWIDERLASMSVTDGVSTMPFPRQIADLFKLGWVIANRQLVSGRALYVLCLPVRSSACHWVALGCLAGLLASETDASARNEFMRKQPGDEAVISIEHGKSRNGKIIVRVRVEEIIENGGDRQIKFRIIEGKNTHVGAAITMDYRKWQRSLKPGTRLVRGMSKLIGALWPFYSLFIPNADVEWFLDKRTRLTIVGNVAAMNRSIEGVAIADHKSRKEVGLSKLLCTELGKVQVVSNHTKQAPPFRETLILNGPEALRVLDPDLRGNVIVILAWPEVDASIQTCLSPYLSADNPAIAPVGLSGMVMPRQWTLLEAASGHDGHE